MENRENECVKACAHTASASRFERPAGKRRLNRPSEDQQHFEEIFVGVNVNGRLVDDFARILHVGSGHFMRTLISLRGGD